MRWRGDRGLPGLHSNVPEEPAGGRHPVTHRGHRAQVVVDAHLVTAVLVRPYFVIPFRLTAKAFSDSYHYDYRAKYI